MLNINEIKTLDAIEKIISLAANGETIVISHPGNNVVILPEDEYNVMVKAKKNAEYREKIEKAIADVRAGNVITKTMEELEAMANE